MMIYRCIDWFNTFRRDSIVGGSQFKRELLNLPPGLLPYWQQTAEQEFNGIPRDAIFFTRAAEGLMMFFDCVRRSGRPCGLPSRAADSVWHAWERFDPQGLEEFCLRHFKRAIPHTEGAQMSIPMDQALAHTLVAARIRQMLPLGGMNVPHLFSLDRKLYMPHGYAYSLAEGQVGWRHMDEYGLPVGPVHRNGHMEAAQLLAAGLIPVSAYNDYVKRTEDKGGGGCGSGCGSSACDGGSSCGSGCGGGCGGGCG